MMARLMRLGLNNKATGFAAAVSDGAFNTASGFQASVSGGRFNVAAGETSSISGGSDRTVAEPEEWRVGSLHR